MAMRPGWYGFVSDALRGLLLGIPFDLGPDLSVLIVAAAASIVAAASLLDRLAR